MKKYSLGLLFATLIFSFFSVLTVDASVSGCMTGDRYSRTTGQACTTSGSNVCQSGDIYNSYTGERCATETPISRSCDVTYERALTFGSRGNAVSKLQQILKDEGLLASKVDGVYGPMTDGARKSYEKSCVTSSTAGMSRVVDSKVYETPTTETPVVSLISTTIISVLSPDETHTSAQGKLKFRVYSPLANIFISRKNTDNLAKGVSDSNSFSLPGVVLSTTSTNSNLDSSAYFVVKGGESREFAIDFFMSPARGDGFYKVKGGFLSLKDGRTLNLGSNFVTDLIFLDSRSNETQVVPVPVPVPNTTPIPGPLPVEVSTLKVTSPNGGENWTAGDVKSIILKADSSSTYDISLVAYYPPCPSVGNCIANVIRGPYVLAQKVGVSSLNSLGSYLWWVGMASNSTSIPAGSYTVQICKTGTNKCDSSDSYFTIISTSATTPISSTNTIPGPLPVQ